MLAVVVCHSGGPRSHLFGQRSRSNLSPWSGLTSCGGPRSPTLRARFVLPFYSFIYIELIELAVTRFNFFHIDVLRPSIFAFFWFLGFQGCGGRTPERLFLDHGTERETQHVRVSTRRLSNSKYMGPIHRPGISFLQVLGLQSAT